jgi:hypothetical protein
MLLSVNQPCGDDTVTQDAARLEPALWNDQNVARTESNIVFDVTISDQAVILLLIMRRGVGVVTADLAGNAPLRGLH